jgi:hypothetical protein
MASRLTTTDDAPERKVVAVPWKLFLSWASDVWKTGQHIAVIGPTGEGKTTIVKPLLDLRKWVIVLDPKGLDETLEQYGFQRITDLPLSSKIRNAIAEGKPARLIIGGESDTREADKRLRTLMDNAIEMVRQQGGWTLFADEFQILADRRMFGLDKPVERALVSARTKHTSVVTAFQAPAWVPKAATRQASFVIMLPTRDIDMIRAVARAMGRDWQDLFKAVQELPQFHDLVIPKSPRAPMILVHPPEL